MAYAACTVLPHLLRLLLCICSDFATKQYAQYKQRLAAAFPPRSIGIFRMYLVLSAVCPFMIYGEVVQKWRLAKGATLRKWPHAAGTAPSHISRSLAQWSKTEQSIVWQMPGGPLSIVPDLFLVSAVCVTILPACHIVSSALTQHDATILHVIR